MDLWGLQVNGVDLAVVVILVLSGVLALVRGLVRELVVLAVWIGSVVLAALLYPLVKPWMATHIHSEMGADAASALALFCLALVVLIPLGHIVSGLIKGETLTAIDRSLGFVFGVLRGILVVCLLYLGASWVWPDAERQPSWLKEAKTRPVLIYGADVVRSLVPKDKLDKATKGLDQQKAALDKASENIDQLNKLSVLVPQAKPQQAPTYGAESRSTMDRLIQEKGK